VRKFFQSRVAAVAVGAAVIVGVGATGAVAAGMVGSPQIRNQSIRAIDIKAGAVGAAELGNSSVRSAKISDGGIGIADLQPLVRDRFDDRAEVNGVRHRVAALEQQLSDGSGSSLSSTLGHLLYVDDGTQQMSTLTYELDKPLAFEDVDLTFFQELVHEGAAASGFGANVILGVDANDDGHYDAKDLAWHVGTNPQDPALLKGDTFVEMDGLPPSETKVTAQDVAQWYTPGQAGPPNAFANNAGCEYNQTLVDFVNNCTASTGDNGPRFDAGDKIEVIRLVLGGSSSWQDVAYRLTTLGVGGEIKEIDQVSFPRNN